MRKNFFKKAMTALAIMAVSVLAINLLTFAPAFAQGAATGIDLIEGGPTDIRGFITTAVNFLLGFLGLIAVLMIVYAGFLYITSATNEDNIGQAKNIILYAVVGIVVILASAAIVNFAFDVTSGGGTTTSLPTTL